MSAQMDTRVKQALIETAIEGVEKKEGKAKLRKKQYKVDETKRCLCLYICMCVC
jgi:hypothetical protein